MVKINFDGEIFSRENKSDIKVVIRDSLGSIIASSSKKVPQAFSSSEVEALAVATTLSFTVEIGINRVVFGGDSLELKL